MKKLDFMIVGAQKCGTTALSEFLDQHPKIQMAQGKETHLFDGKQFDSKWSADEISNEYESFFPESANADLMGEATPIYLYFPEIAERLTKYNPDLRLIVILRDPTERAYSHYLMEYERGNESKPFWLALLLENYRIAQDENPRDESSSLRRHSYRSRGCYARQLENLLSHFPQEQILVLRNEELRDDHAETLKRVFEFLGVPEAQVESRTVFSRESTLSEVPVSSYLLRRSYQRELNVLEQMVHFSVEAWR